MKKLILLYALFCFCCNSDSSIKKIDSQKGTPVRQETSIFFFTKPKDTYHIKNRVAKSVSLINLLNENGYENEFVYSDSLNIFQYSKPEDISTVKHDYRNYGFYFELKKGDSVVYTIKDGLPFYIGTDSILNESNLFDYKRLKYLNNSPPYDFFSYYLLNKDKIKNNDTLKKRFKKELKVAYQKEQFLLDSLYNLNQITMSRYNLQKEKLKFNYLNLMFPEDWKKAIDNDLFIEELEREDLIKYGFYKEFLSLFTINKFKIKNLRKSNQVVLDSKTRFDSISASIKFPKKIKSYLLYNNLVEIGSNFSQSDFETYFNKFDKDVDDSIFMASIKNKFLTNFSEIQKEVKRAHFITRQNKGITLLDLLNENKGKLVYIDFWASWCAPCRSAMPASRDLQKKYKDKDIVFIYISIDKDFEKWDRASITEDLSFSKNNFFAVNYPNATLYEVLKLNAIPRYLLYDKNGELLNENAPEPGTKEITELIDIHL